ncbi:MAG: GNAT family N-acetyltransferase [Geminicoccaceae bacterium]
MGTSLTRAGLALASPRYRRSFVEALREGFRRGVGAAKSAGEIELIDADFEDYVARATDRTGMVTLPNGKHVPKVPFDVFWLVDGQTFIGETSIRYQLNDWLIQAGGHIGYGIRPTFQQRGFGKLILKMSLEKCLAYGIDRVLVTCNDSNIASAKIIEANGGVLEDLRDDPLRSGLLRRYWIDLTGTHGDG